MLRDNKNFWSYLVRWVWGRGRSRGFGVRGPTARRPVVWCSLRVRRAGCPGLRWNCRRRCLAVPLQLGSGPTWCCTLHSSCARKHKARHSVFGHTAEMGPQFLVWANSMALADFYFQCKFILLGYSSNEFITKNWVNWHLFNSSTC